MALDTGYGTDLAMPARAAQTSLRTTEDEDDGDYWSLEKCKRCYENYLRDKQDEIIEQKESRRYRHGVQWTSTQVEIFNKRKQPVVTYNRIGRKINAIVGLMEKLRMDPKGFPRNPRQTDERGAELATAAIRYVIDSELKENIFPFAIEMAAVDGIAGVELMLIEGDQGDPDVGFALLQTDSVFYDTRSYSHDFEDARYMGQGKWLDIEDAKELVPEKADEIESATHSGGGSELTTDPDRERRWFDQDKDHKRIRVVDIWYKHKGGWCWCLFTGGIKLMEGKSYFFDEKKKPICKYLMFSAFVDQDGDRYGFVRPLKSSQDEINQRRSKGLHELMSRRIKAEDGAFADIELTRREAVRPDGVVLYNKGFEMEFDDQVRLANLEGHLKFLEDAKNEIENFGPNPALIGQGLEYKSGRAINLLQQAGIAELGPFVIGVKNWKLRLYRAIWSAIQRYWTGERWIRVTDDEGLAQFIQVNGVGIDETTGMPQMINFLGQLDVNFVLDEGPDETNMMGDAYDTLIALASQGAKVGPEILIELSPLHASIKRKLLAILSRPDPVKEEAKQVALASEKANIGETVSRAHLNEAKAAESARGGARDKEEIAMEGAQKERDSQLKIYETKEKVKGKQMELGVKLQGQREQTALKAQESQMKVQATAQETAMNLRANEAQTRQKLVQGEQQHRQKLQQGEQQLHQNEQKFRQDLARPKGPTNGGQR